MGRYWSTRRAGSRGPSAAHGSALPVLMTGLVLTQPGGAGTELLCNWTPVAAPGIEVLFSLQADFGAGFVEINAFVLTNGTAFFETGESPEPGAGHPYFMVAFADGYDDVISPTIMPG